MITRKFYKCEDCGMYIEEDELADCVQVHRELDYDWHNEEHYTGCPWCEGTNLTEISVCCGTCEHFDSSEDMCPFYGEVDAVFDGNDCECWQYNEKE